VLTVGLILLAFYLMVINFSKVGIEEILIVCTVFTFIIGFFPISVLFLIVLILVYFGKEKEENE